jgi:hypothetical protein
LDYPNGVTLAILKRVQIESFFDLPESKRPPESIWDNPKLLKNWFDRVFERNKKDELVINIPDSEIE